MTPPGVRRVLEMLTPVGRYDDTDPSRLRMAWSGTGFDARFDGTSLEADLTDSVAWIDVAVDGTPPRAVELAPGSGWVVLADGLQRGEHSVSVRKRTEPLVGELVVSGLRSDGRILTPPARSGIRLEFVGDSITCGYGNLAPDETYPFDPATEDFALSFAGLTASALGADVHCVAWSGLGLVRNFDIEPSPTLVQRHGYSNPVTRALWDFSRWLPEIVVVNLGSNDFYRTPPPEPGLFRAELEVFVARQLERGPGTKVVLLDGPLLKDGFPIDESGRKLSSLATVREHLDHAASRFPSGRVFRLSLSSADPARGWGADWHPSLAQHRLNAQELLAFLRETVIPD
jgi:endoglucanase